VLRYNQNVPSCANIASQNGVFFDTKNKLKGAASLLRASAKSYNNVNDLNGCVVPNEVSGILNTGDCSVVSYSYENGQVNNMFQLPRTIDGDLSINQDTANQQLSNGESVYPLDGCFFNITGNDPNKFTATVGEILDYENQLVLQPLRKKLQKLKDDCAELDRQIAAMRDNISRNQATLDDLLAKCKFWAEQKLVIANRITTEITRRQEEARRKAEEEARLMALYAETAARGEPMPPELANQVAQINVPAGGGANPDGSANINDATVVILYKGINFTGFAFGVGMGTFDLCSLESFGFRFGEIMSIRFVKPAQITVFENENYTGRSQIFYSNVPNLAQYNFQGKIASIIVAVTRGPLPPPPEVPPVVVLYSEANFNDRKGWNITLKPGRYNIQALRNINRNFKNDTASSIKFLRPGRATLFKDDNFRGSNVTVTKNVLYLGDLKFNDKMSSIEVIGDPIPEPKVCRK